MNSLKTTLAAATVTLWLAACSAGDKPHGGVPERAGATTEQVRMCLSDDRKALLNLHGISPELQHAYDLCVEFVQSHPQEAQIATRFVARYMEEGLFNETLKLPDDNAIWPKFEAIAKAVESAPDYELLVKGAEDSELLAQFAAKESEPANKGKILAYITVIFLIFMAWGLLLGRRY